MKLLNFLLAEASDAPQADWITTTFPIIRYCLVGIMLISAITIIITCLLQSDDTSGGTNVISGVQESYYAQNKGESRDGKLKKITKIAAIVITISIVLYFVTCIFNG